MFYVRVKFVAAFIFLMMLLVLARLAYMQIANVEHYRQEAKRRQVSVTYPNAPRGLVLARDGTTVLADDRPVLNVCVRFGELFQIPRERLREWCATVASISGDTPDGVTARLGFAWDAIEDQVARRVKTVLSRGAAGSTSLEKQAQVEARLIRTREYARGQILYADVGFRIAARAEVASADLPGLAVTQAMARKYPNGSLAAHVMGYVNEITPEEWDLYRYEYGSDERKRVGYHDVMGRAGIEKQYNFELKGLRGKLEKVINAYGDTQKILAEDFPHPGRTITLTIDPLLQKAAEEGLAEILKSAEPRAGAAVCMDVDTGEILAMASSPVYNPNSIGKDWTALNDPDGIGKFHPFQDRAVDSAYPLGSVFKIIVTTAGLESGALTENTTFTCDGVYRLGKREFHCWISRAPYFSAHGPISLIRALQVSCNIYFAQAGLKVGGPSLVEWALGYGFGSPSGVDLAFENGGNIPYPRYPGDVVNMSIGQGRVLVTPLQVCRMAAAVANGGTLVNPHLNCSAVAAKTRRVGFSSATHQTLRKALYEVVNVHGGTGYTNVRSDKITIAGKTGTAQAPPQGDISGDHAWFAGFAPFDDPKIAIAVVIEHGGHGGAVAGPVAKRIAEAYADETALQTAAAAGQGGAR